MYSNEDTGVYFVFDINEGGPSEDRPEAGDGPPSVSLNVNFFRPHVFGLEAEPEVAAFIQKFECRIQDPQNEGMDEGAYSREGFLCGWNAGNRFGFHAIGKDKDFPPPWAAEPALIDAIWTWNLARAGLQKAIGDHMFVPRISWFLPSGASAPVPAATWTERVPTVIPDRILTHVALVRPPRKTMKSRLGLSTLPNFEVKIVDVSEVAATPGVHRGDAVGQDVLFTPIAGPLETQKVFAGVWSAGGGGVVATENICGADLVALMKKDA